MRNDKDLYTQNCNLRAKTIQEKTFNKIIVKNEIKPVQRSYTTKNTNKNKTKKKKIYKKESGMYTENANDTFRTQHIYIDIYRVSDVENKIAQKYSSQIIYTKAENTDMIHVRDE